MTHPHQPRAVLWDLDGTILDSREYHWLSWREAVAAEGMALTEGQFAASFGQRNDTIVRTWLGPDLSEAEVARIADVKETIYRELVRTRGVSLLPGVARWLTALRRAGWRQALATSAPPANVAAILDALDIGTYFCAIVHADDVSRGKPDPQVFLLAAERLGVPPERCVVVEDAPAGVEAARRAGMRSVGVGPAASAAAEDASLPADLAVGSLDVLPADAIARLLA